MNSNDLPVTRRHVLTAGLGAGCEKTGREKQTAASAKAPAGTRFLYMVFLYMAPDD